MISITMKKAVFILFSIFIAVIFVLYPSYGVRSLYGPSCFDETICVGVGLGYEDSYGLIGTTYTAVYAANDYGNANQQPLFERFSLISLLINLSVPVIICLLIYLIDKRYILISKTSLRSKVKNLTASKKH
jgi:hypothetical protein